ncbi:HPr kinase/phosphorylase [Bienertia sinuspersici]
MKKEEMAQMMSSLSSSSSCICLCMKNHSFPGLPVRQLFVSGELKTCLATTKLRASVDDIANDTSSSPLVQHQDHPNQEVVESIKVLKNAAKTRKVDKNKVLSALSVIEKAKLDPSKFLEMLGGAKSPGRTWMLIFTAENNLNGGRYFPLTAVQRFDAEAKRIENGVYLGPLGSLSFEGRLSWKNRILAFIFECVRIKVGPFNPLQISLGNQDNREPNNKDPFFIWFYIDEEIAVARGKSGGTAFWCRCSRVSSP